MVFEKDGARMSYRLSGEGAPLLLLHGWGGRADSFLPVERDFAARHKIIAVDFPGHGDSPPPPAPWSVDEYAAFTYALLEHLGAKGADVIAHSFGGRVALVLASAHPESVNRLVLTGCAGLRGKPSAKKRLRARLYKLLKALAPGEKAREALIARFGSPDYRALSPEMRQTFNRVIGQDLHGCLSNIKASTLLIWGTADEQTPLWMGKIMEAEIPDAGLVELAGAGHFAYLDRYAEFRAVTSRFLDGN